MNYTITNQNLEIEIASHGAELKAVRYCGINYLHDGNPAFWNRTAPLLFPNIGSIKNNETIINNQPYHLTKHGFIREREFNVIDHEKSSITFRYTSNADDLVLYPFKFQFDVTYQIHGNVLKSYIVITNLSENTMLFNLGLHPAFKVPLFPNESFEDYHFVFEKPGTYDCPTVNLKDGTIDYETPSRHFDNLKILPLNYQDYQNDALIFQNLATHQISLVNKDESHGVHFEFYDFPILGIWTPNHAKANFICIEPWIGGADSINHNGQFSDKKAIMKLEPKEEKLITYQIKFF